MKNLFFITFCLVLLIFGCTTSKKEKANNIKVKIEVTAQEHLFKLGLLREDNFVSITAPANSDFILPDRSAKTEPYKVVDFNADVRNDIMVYLGACGTGGCMYGLFLNQYDQYYKLVFMDYLKGLEFEKGQNNFFILKSYEELDAYNPSKLQVSIYKFDPNKYLYKLDSTYISYDSSAD